ncbi:MAG: hypothetical protein FJ271_18610 [Planctomycetes bacterium]|nr:hypothetical protein [Planctomycetota bacterium]
MEILQSFWQILVNLGALAVGIVTLGIHWFALVAWLAWWLFGVNWRKVWPVLAGGGWVPLVLLIVLGAAAWSALQPVPPEAARVANVPSFWWRLGGVSLLAGVTLLCGWLQDQFQWTPQEINLDPPTAPATHAHH